MHLTALTKFLALVTPERLEAYLREKGWRPGFQNAQLRQWRRCGTEDLDIVDVALVRLRDYVRMVADAAEQIACAENRPATAVLYDLLPPEHRGELVKAVFPAEAARIEEIELRLSAERHAKHELADHCRVLAQQARLLSAFDQRVHDDLASEEPPEDFRQAVYAGGEYLGNAWRWMRLHLLRSFKMEDASKAEHGEDPNGADPSISCNPTEALAKGEGRKP